MFLVMVMLVKILFFIPKVIITSMIVSVDEEKSREIPEYVYSQLDSASRTIQINRDYMMFYEEEIKQCVDMGRKAKEKRLKLMKKYITLENQTVSMETKIRKLCRQYYIDEDLYL